MLGMKKYPRKYFEECRKRVDADVAAYKKLVVSAKSAPASAIEAFERAFFNNMVLVLEYMFEHRLTGLEGKDGNPLNEVRVLSNSLLLNRGKLQIDKLPGWPNSASGGMKLSPETSVLKLEQGDTIALTEGDFKRLSKAYFDEIQKKFV